MKNTSRHSAPDRHSLARRTLLRGAALLFAVVLTNARSLFAQTEASGRTPADDHMHRTLGLLARHLFPHAGLAAEPYVEVASALMDRVSTDERFAMSLRAGVVGLDSGSSIPWLAREESGQLAAIRRIEDSEFFRIVRSTTIEHLYRNKLVWDLIGYEGSSVEFGGYLDRGFDDIDWLPDSGHQ